ADRISGSFYVIFGVEKKMEQCTVTLLNSVLKGPVITAGRFSPTRRLCRKLLKKLYRPFCGKTFRWFGPGAPIRVFRHPITFYISMFQKKFGIRDNWFLG